MIKQTPLLLGLICAAAIFSGCTTVSVYQDPVAKFQTAVNTANDSLRPYLLGVNDLNAKANLYDKVLTGQPWGSEDLTNAIPPKELQVRLQALTVIASYANALGAVVNSKDVANLTQAAKSFGDDVNGLNLTVQELAATRLGGSSGKTPVAAKAAALDISAPLTSLVTLAGTLAIEHQQKKAVETAIKHGEQPINQLIDLLKVDLRSLTAADNASYAAIQAGMVAQYTDARGKTDSKGMPALIDQFIQDNNRIETLRNLQVDSLLTDLKSAHSALVTFSNSSKKPQDFAALASQIDVFTAHVKLFDAAISAIQTTVKSTQ